MNATKLLILSALMASPALADLSVSDYEDLPEGFYGQSLHYNGVTYNDVNSVAGVFPDGNTFEPGGDGVDTLGNEIIIENATFLYNDFPGWGSANHGMTFGRSFIPGDNLSLGPISTVTMDLDQPADSASLDVAYFENGPWGGIVYHFDAYMGGSIVASDSFVISDLGGRDNPAIATMQVGGVLFDSLRLSATLGSEFSAPRVLIDDLTLNTVPTPASALCLIGAAAGAIRRRR